VLGQLEIKNTNHRNMD